MRDRFFFLILFLAIVVLLARLFSLGYLDSEQVFVINLIARPVQAETVADAVRKALGTRNVSDYIDLNRNLIRFNWAKQNLLEPSPPIALIVVSSTPEQKRRRVAIRQSWANWTEDYPVKLVFYVGIPSNGDLRALALESLFYDDLIVDEFEDSIYSASIKTLRIFRWFLDFYDSSPTVPRFLVKSDDDVFIHIPNLVRHLRTLENNTAKYLAGALHTRATVTRRLSSKFYVPFDIWSQRHYPPYLSGPCYIMSADLVAKLFGTSFHVPLFHLEDVYITGMLANLTLGVELHGLPPDVMVEKAAILGRALQLRTNVWKAIAYHGVDRQMMKHLFRVASLHAFI